MFTPAVRRYRADEVPATWASDHTGQHHGFIYDVPAIEDGHVINGVKQWSWLWVALLGTEIKGQSEVWPTRPDGSPPRVSIWSGPKGRWLDGEDPAQDGRVGGDYRGWAIPAGGRTAVVSLDDVPLSVYVDTGVGLA